MPKLLFVRPTGWGTERPEAGRYYAKICNEASRYPGLEIGEYNPQNARIHQGRNAAVKAALEHGYDLVLMLDPDMDPDRYVGKDPQAKPFFQTAWNLMASHDGPCICAAPYCGRSPDNNVHVFARQQDDEITRVPRWQAAEQTGWMEVEAVGTGLMLIDTDVFRLVDAPWFEDVWADKEQTNLARSQDTSFCLKARKAGVPIYVNFDCWAGHFQIECVERPERPEPPRHCSGDHIVDYDDFLRQCDSSGSSLADSSGATQQQVVVSDYQRISSGNEVICQDEPEPHG